MYAGARLHLKIASSRKTNGAPLEWELPALPKSERYR